MRMGAVCRVRLGERLFSTGGQGGPKTCWSTNSFRGDIMDALVKGSIGQLARESGKSIAETFIGADVVVLVDTSGSMGTCDAVGKQSRYDAACRELASLQANLPGKLAVLSFSDVVIFCPNGQPINLHSSTNLAGALRFAKVADVADMRFIVVSDGEPDDASAALTVARTYTNRIDVIYIGSELSKYGQDFLNELARASGGVSIAPGKAAGLGMIAEKLLLGG